MNRYGFLLKRELRTSQKDLSTYGLTIILVLFFFETMQNIVTQYSWGSYGTEVYDQFFSSFLLLGGFILTSLNFAEDMFGRSSQHEWLMLPATSLEKFLSKAVLVTFAYPLALTLLFFATSLVTEPLQLLFFGNPIHLFNPFTLDVLPSFASFWVWNSVFLLGATYFRKAHFIKTVLAIGLVFLALGSLAMIFIRIIFSIKYGNSVGIFDTFYYFGEGGINSSVGLRAFAVLSKLIYYIGLPAFCWVTAFFRVEEVQATDAV